MKLNLPKLQARMRWIFSGVGILLVGLFLYSFLPLIISGITVEKALELTLSPIGTWMASKIFFEVSIFGSSIELIVVWMALPMILLSFYYGFINFRGFKQAWRILRGRYADDNAAGEVSQFQALATALSGTVGLGNIAGVAIAIAVGGPGAALWMFMISLLAMAVKFSECTLAVKYRTVHRDGTVSGGPMYYLYEGLKRKGLVTFGAILAVLYAVFTLPSILQIVQVNQAYSQISFVIADLAPGASEYFTGLAFGIFLAILTGIVIIGGLRSIARVTSRLVPIMAGIYITAALVIIFSNYESLLPALSIIVETAFNPGSVGGGIIGVIVTGMRRAVYSTEAGLGSSTIAHAAAKTNEPVSEGFVGLMEPFIDTFVGTMTALVIVITGAYTLGLGDIQMTSVAFSREIEWFALVLAVAVFLFAFSTIISWSYYIEKVWTYLFGDTKRSVVIFKIVFCILIIPGAVIPTDQVIDIMDSLFFLLAIPNIIGLYIMAPELKADLKDYLHRVKTGQIKEVKA